MECDSIFEKTNCKQIKTNIEFPTDDTFESTIDLQQSTIHNLKRELNSAKDVIFRLRRNEDKLREKYRFKNISKH